MNEKKLEQLLTLKFLQATKKAIKFATNELDFPEQIPFFNFSFPSFTTKCIQQSNDKGLKTWPEIQFIDIVENTQQEILKVWE